MSDFASLTISDEKEVIVDNVEVKILDLADDVLQLVMSKLSIIEQQAVVRVCTRFDGAAFKLTKTMAADELPFKFRLGILEKLPKLRKVRMFYAGPEQESDKKKQRFFEALAKSHPNLERLLGVTSEWRIFFVQMVKKHHPINDLCKFKTFVNEPNYEDLIKKIPGITIRHKILTYEPNDSSQMELQGAMLSGVIPRKYTSERTLEERFSNPKLVGFVVYLPCLDYDFSRELSLAMNNITHITIVHTGDISTKPEYGKYYDMAATIVHLNKFSMMFNHVDPGRKVYGWSKRDEKAFQNLIETKRALVDIRMDLPAGKPTFEAAMKCFLGCSRNNFHHFAVYIPDPTITNVWSPFYIRPLSQFYPKILLGFPPGTETQFPWSQFITKFSPKYREFEVRDPNAMRNVAKSLIPFIRQNLKVHFVLYSEIQNEIKIFKPIQIDSNDEPFFTTGKASHVKQYERPQFYRTM